MSLMRSPLNAAAWNGPARYHAFENTLDHLGRTAGRLLAGMSQSRRGPTKLRRRSSR
jgi:hypothetical protein